MFFRAKGECFLVFQYSFVQHIDTAQSPVDQLEGYGEVAECHPTIGVCRGEEVQRLEMV